MNSNRRILTTTLMVTILTLGVGLGAAWAQDAPGADGDRPDRGSRWMERLDLTEQQKAQIEKIREDGQDRAVEIRKTLMRLEHDLKGQMIAENPSSNEVLALVRKIGETKTDLRVHQMQKKLAIRELLTPEQRDKFMLMKKNGNGRRGGKGMQSGHRRPGGRGRGDGNGRAPRGGHGGEFGQGLGPCGEGDGPRAGCWDLGL